VNIKIYIPVDINECESTPCLNDGLCVDGINSYKCKCKDNYMGDNCETSKFFSGSQVSCCLIQKIIL
jgi:hypothetical protein